MRVDAERIFARSRPHLEGFQPVPDEAILSELYPNQGLAQRLDVWLASETSNPERLAEMVLPAPLRNNADFTEVTAGPINRGKTTFEIVATGPEFSLKFSFRLYPMQPRCPARLFVEEYLAKLPISGGTQAFYKNLHAQFAHLDVPVIHGVNAPDNIGYYLHRVGRIPVGMLDTKFEGIIDGIGRYDHMHRADYLRGYGDLANTVSLNGLTPMEMLRPDFRAPFQALQTEFDAMSEVDRRADYRDVMRRTFGIY